MAQLFDPQRKFPRKRYDRSIKCITTSLMFDCRGVNLGPGGACIRSPIPFEPGDEFAMLIPIGNNGDNIIIALGKVIWTQDHEEELNDYPVYAGIQFTATANKFRPELDSLCFSPD
jgi:hypothetical protein